MGAVPHPLAWSLVGAPGVGPSRERMLWQAGGWNRDRLPMLLPEIGIRGEKAEGVLRFIDHLDNALQQADLERVFELIPTRERWRLIPLLLDGAAYVDVETDAAGELTLVAVRTKDSAELWFQGLDTRPVLELLANARSVVSFNGLAFDLPKLRKAFPDARFPKIHVDLVHLTRRLKVAGGLKGAEQSLGWTRAPHLAHLRGNDAIGLWSAWAFAKDFKSLKILCEYNMEDVWSLPMLAAWAYDGLAEKTCRAAVGAPVHASASRDWHQRAEFGPTVLDAVIRALGKLSGGVSSAS